MYCKPLKTVFVKNNRIKLNKIKVKIPSRKSEVYGDCVC